jgi:hypothetical protein
MSSLWSFMIHVRVLLTRIFNISRTDIYKEYQGFFDIPYDPDVPPYDSTLTFC